MTETDNPDLSRSVQSDVSEEGSDYPLEIGSLSKSYRHVTALDDVSLHVGEGEVVGLVGENGAGKSTLLKILTGVLQPDSGQISVHGQQQTFTDTIAAAEEGISLVHQEQDIITNLTGAENLFMGREGNMTRFGYFNKKRMVEEAERQLDELGIRVDVGERAADLTFNERQLLEIARAFTIAQEGDTDNPIILLDEPTSGLEEGSRELLFELIEELSSQASFVFVSHELDEVIEVCDRIYVLKDGQLVDEMSASEATEESLRNSMVGRASSGDYYKTSQQLPAEELGETVLAVKDLAIEERLGPVSFSLQNGEILGVVGVDGSGKEELGRMLYGDSSPTSGTMTVQGEAVTPTSPATMKAAGLGYIPKDRKAEGVLLYQPVRHNTSLAIVDDMFDKLPFLDIGWEKEMTEEAIEELGVKTPGMEVLAHQLSGGNQQKVVLGRWFAKESPILIMDNVTRGIDVGAKEDVYELCREFTRQGISMVFIGDELPEVIGISNRIAVMYKGEIVDIIDASAENKPDETELIELMI